MNKLFYPAIFHEAEEGGFWVEFPDLPECLSQGENLEECYEMASEALGLAITSRQEANEELPLPSLPGTLKNVDGTIIVVEFDLLAYKRKHCSKSIKKTLTIPEWLNDAAMNAGINFSKVLQDALKAQLNLQ